MSRRSVLVAVAAGAGAVAVARRRRRAGRVDVYYVDGSVATLEPGAPEARRILVLAGEALAAASA